MITNLQDLKKAFVAELSERGIKDTFKNRERIVKDIRINPSKSERLQDMFNFMFAARSYKEKENEKIITGR